MAPALKKIPALVFEKIEEIEKFLELIVEEITNVAGNNIYIASLLRKQTNFDYISNQIISSVRY